jgi:hypothetical protein
MSRELKNLVAAEVKKFGSSYIIRYHIYGKPITNSDFIYFLNSDQSFRKTLTKSIVDLPTEAIYLESPMMQEKYDKKVFFLVAVEAKFASGDACYSSFREHLTAGSSGATSFPNLGRDCTLIVPQPESGYRKYRHLKQYLTYGSESSVDNFWVKVAEAAKANYASGFFLKTDGRSVPYIHYRVQVEPKYYETSQLKSIHSSDLLYKTYFPS